MAGNPMMLDKFFDECTRNDIKNVVETHCTENREYSILLVGSPNAWELKDIPLNIKNKINLTCIDLSHKFEPEFTECTSGYNSKKFTAQNIFHYVTEDKFDIIINRWFLHHLTTKNKKDFFTTCSSLLTTDGLVISVDYFFTKFSNLNERLEAATKYNGYRSKYSPEPNLSKFLSRVRTAEVEDYKGGKMDCIDNIKSLLNSINLTTTYQYTSDSKQIEFPELWGHYIILNSKTTNKLFNRD
jgi:hypothetical protein